MTRGKEELAALRRRNEGLEIACALANDQLAEYKLRARQVEAAARQLPGMEADVARLRQQLELVTGPQVARLQRENTRLVNENLALKEKLHKIVKNWKKLTGRFVETHGGTNLEGYEELASFIGDEDIQVYDPIGGAKRRPTSKEALVLDRARGLRRPAKPEPEEATSDRD